MGAELGPLVRVRRPQHGPLLTGGGDLVGASDHACRPFTASRRRPSLGRAHGLSRCTGEGGRRPENVARGGGDLDRVHPGQVDVSGRGLHPHGAQLGPCAHSGRGDGEVGIAPGRDGRRDRRLHPAAPVVGVDRDDRLPDALDHHPVGIAASDLDGDGTVTAGDDLDATRGQPDLESRPASDLYLMAAHSSKLPVT